MDLFNQRYKASSIVTLIMLASQAERPVHLAKDLRCTLPLSLPLAFVLF